MELWMWIAFVVGCSALGMAYRLKRGTPEDRAVESWDQLRGRFALNDDHYTTSTYRKLAGEVDGRAATVGVDVEQHAEGGMSGGTTDVEFTNVSVEFSAREFSDVGIRRRSVLGRLFGLGTAQSQFGFKKMAYEESEPPQPGSNFDDQFEIVGEASDELCRALANREVIDAMAGVLGRSDELFIEGGEVRWRSIGVNDADRVTAVLHMLSTVAAAIDSEH